MGGGADSSSHRSCHSLVAPVTFTPLTWSCSHLPVHCLRLTFDPATGSPDRTPNPEAGSDVRLGMDPRLVFGHLVASVSLLLADGNRVHASFPLIPLSFLLTHIIFPPAAVLPLILTRLISSSPSHRFGIIRIIRNKSEDRETVIVTSGQGDKWATGCGSTKSSFWDPAESEKVP